MLESQIASVVEDSLKRNGICSLLVGVSGGCDSVALLRALVANGRLLKKLHAVHCNFHLRGDESDRDERFVRDLCKHIGVSLSVVHFDVGQYKAKNGGSVEMVCRDLRYAEFDRILKEKGLQYVAVAHNLDDNVETFFLNLMRSAGSRGLRGMQEVSGNVFRPLLNVSRSSIESYLKRIGQSFITDSTNLENDYNRNFLRNCVIPLLAERWSGIRSSVTETQRILCDENRLVDYFINKALEGNRYFLSREAEGLYVSPLTFFYRFISPFGGSSRVASEMAETLRKDYQGRMWRLSEKYIVSEERTGWEVLEVKDSLVDNYESELPEGYGWERVALTPEVWEMIKSDKSNTVFWTSAEPGQYLFRPPKQGDRMSVVGMRGSSLLSDIIKDAHLSRKEKMRCRLAFRRDTGEIVWVLGLKRSAIDLIRQDDKFVWCLSQNSVIL